jgi:hypothetical protein
LLLFGAESFVFQFLVQKYISVDEEVQNCNFSVVLCAYEALSLTLREEPKLRVFKNRVLRRIFGPKTDEVAGDWRRLRNEELYDLLTKYYSGDQIKKNEIGRAFGTYGRHERCIQGFF